MQRRLTIRRTAGSNSSLITVGSNLEEAVAYESAVGWDHRRFD